MPLPLRIVFFLVALIRPLIIFMSVDRSQRSIYERRLVRESIGWLPEDSLAIPWVFSISPRFYDLTTTIFILTKKRILVFFVHCVCDSFRSIREKSMSNIRCLNHFSVKVTIVNYLFSLYVKEFFPVGSVHTAYLPVARTRPSTTDVRTGCVATWSYRPVAEGSRRALLVRPV